MEVNSAYIESIAFEFWKNSCLPIQSPPYDIAGAVSILLPLDIVLLSELTLKKISEWLSKRRIQVSINISDRFLHGFILINRGAGFIFVDGTDSEDERRYTIAHEVSHFLLDYKLPRDKIITKIGGSINEVIDGLRDATTEELLAGIINGVNPRPFTHLMEKEGNGSFLRIDVFDAENKADALALELLAPRLEIIKATLSDKAQISFQTFETKCIELLLSVYKLPASIAEQYAKQLAYALTGGPALMEKFGF